VSYSFVFLYNQQTNLVVCIIDTFNPPPEDGKHFEQTYDSIFIVSPECDQPLYQLLRRQYSSDMLKFCSIDTMPKMEDVKDKGRNSLIIFDDLILEKKQTPFEEFYIKGRHFGWTVIYLAQTYFETEKNIRVNANIVAMLHGGGTSRNIGDMVADVCLGVSKEEALAMYSIATAKPLQPFVVIKNNSLEERFRNGLFEVFAIPPPIPIAFTSPTTTATTKKSSEKKTPARGTSAQTPPVLKTPVGAVESLLEPFKGDGNFELQPCEGNSSIADYLRSNGFNVIMKRGAVEKMAVLVYSIDDSNEEQGDDEQDDDSLVDDMTVRFTSATSFNPSTNPFN